VERLITLRGELRDGGSYETADAIRDALAAAGLQQRKLRRTVIAAGGSMGASSSRRS
jgi:cysteinyl-tRNA synthetase